MSYEESIERGIELLTLCQELQSEKDGIDRPQPGQIDKTKTLDAFAMDILTAREYMASLHKLIPLMLQLAELGRELERQGKLQLVAGDDISAEALRYLRSEYGLLPSQG